MLADILKIHCLRHQSNFPMPRTSRTVVCREGADEHVLSNNFPNEGLWIYCCNCQSFIAWEKNDNGFSIKECVFCLSSLNPRAYACDHCAIVMVDYDDSTLRKQHMVLAWGAPQPACAGCHQFPSSTPRKHFCQRLQCELATARSSCPYCGIATEQIADDVSKAATAKLDTALAEAEAKTREAEERIRLAEEAARKEVELRRLAEQKAQEMEKRATQGLNQIPQVSQESGSANREAEAAKARAEAEAQARAEAERLAQVAELERQVAERKKAEAEAKAREAEAATREIEERRKRAEEIARHEAQMRAKAEQQAREVAETYTSKLAETQAHTAAVVKSVKKDRKLIALMTAIAVCLAAALVVLIVTLISHLRS